ncbi:MAG: hypothetical protein RL095_3819 [Verrucomicrobiota bacterium]|jgi:hypothetical protein
MKVMTSLTLILLLTTSLWGAEDLNGAREILADKAPDAGKVVESALAASDPLLRASLADYAIALSASDEAGLGAMRKTLAEKIPEYDLGRIDKITADPALQKRRTLAALALVDAEEGLAGRRPSQMQIVPATPADLAIKPLDPVSPVPTLDAVRPDKVLPEDPVKLYNKEVLALAIKLQGNDQSVLPQLGEAAFKVKSKTLASALTKTVLLAHLSNDKQKAFYDAYLLQIKNKFPAKELASHLSFLNSGAFLDTCATCSGGGKIEKACSANCKEGACTSSKCEGGEIAYRGLGGENVQKKCPVCKGSSKCPRCNGSGKTSAPCNKCAGKGTRRSLAKVPEMYAGAVRELVDIATEVDATGDAKAPEIAIAPPPPAPVIVANKTPPVVMPEPEVQPGEGEVIIDTSAVQKDIDRAVTEMKMQLGREERASKKKMATVVEAKYEKLNEITLVLDVTSNFLDSNADYRKQVLEGWHRFWTMRCKSNGLAKDEKVCHVKLISKGDEIGSVKDGKFTLP